ncbi:MAG: hypothetical protein P4L41_05590, partial [Flavipsychrobacter sp.]|nr:hypothetical protein [Flavipsychrobacter sp.]
MSMSNFWNPMTGLITIPRLDVTEEFEIDDVPFSGGGGSVGTIQQVLGAGNNAFGLNLTGIGNLTAGTITVSDINEVNAINVNTINVGALTNVSTINGSSYPPSQVQNNTFS